MKRILLPILLITALLIPSVLLRHETSAQAYPGPILPQADPPASRYTITDLGTLGGDTSQAFGINKEGQVVGLAKLNAQNHHAFLWQDGSMQDLGTLGGPLSFAADINDAGQLVGTSHTSGFDDRAYLWQDGVMQNLGTIGGDGSGAFGINSAGQVVGWDSFTGDYTRAFVWQNGSMQLLGTFGGHSFAEDINDAGQVVGYSSTGPPAPVTHAVLWQNGAMQDLGSLAGGSSRAYSINNAGQVVGGSGHAFLWQNGSMQDLGTLGGSISDAYDINDAGQVVGQSLTASQGYHAFLWENGQMKDLNTLIPADSGWVLREARAINKRGQIVGYGHINGQAHAFLLTPLAYYWDNPNGGSWHEATNWDPLGIPGAGDTTIFDLAGEYTVDATQPPLGIFTPFGFSIDRMVISSTATVNFNNLNLDLVFDSPEEPSLQVNGGGTANINSGAATFSHAIIGGLEPDNPDDPPTARLQIFHSGTSLTGSGRLTIGHLGVGDLFVAGGQLTSVEARLGGDQPGSATVGGDGSLWQTGSIAVGYGVSGTLTIENGGRVDSNTAVVGFGNSDFTSAVKIDFDAPSPGQVSMWAVEDNLTIGQSAMGFVDVGNGGQLVVNQNVSILDGILKVMGRSITNADSLLEVMGSVLVGGPTNRSLLILDNGAEGNISGDLIVGQDGAGEVFLAGLLDASSDLKVYDSTWGTCLIGREFRGGVIIAGNASLGCRNIQLGLVGTGGPGRVEVDGSYLSASEIVRVGQVGSGGGLIEMGNGATIMAGEGMYIAPNGSVTGSGDIFVGIIGVVNEGTLSPGINIVNPPLANAPQHQERTQDILATMAITGTLTISPTGQLAIPLIGNGAGQYGSLAVTGAASLDGVLALDFNNWYAPQQGDTFTFLTATEGVSGTFDSVEISGLAPGFEYELTVLDGQVTLEALNDGVPLGEVYLPLVTH